MRTLIAAIHGIMTSQTDPSWPDKFDAWMLNRDPEVKVLKKEYRAGPWPRWNCWVKDPRLALGLANELELFLTEEGQTDRSGDVSSPQAPMRSDGSVTRRPRSDASVASVWFVAHSNGAVIALLAAKILLARGHKIGGLILTGAAVEADIEKNGVLEWWRTGVLGAAIAYSSPDDEVLDGDPRSDAPRRSNALTTLREWFWGKMMWPYGCLGRTGWLLRGEELIDNELMVDGKNSGSINYQLRNHQPMALTRWFPGGHSTYFTPENIERTFEQIYEDVKNVELVKSGNGSMRAEGDPGGNKNPNGIPTQSPGLRGTSYPGWQLADYSNPERVVASGFPHSRTEGAAQPFQGRVLLRANSQGSSFLATLGWRTQSPRD
jgi:hypothetical protein